MSGKEAKKSKSKKAQNKPAKLFKRSPDNIQSNHLYSLKSRTKIDLFSQQGKSLNVSPTQRAFLANEAFKVFMYARSIGYSIRGAALIATLSAKEGSYGDEKTYKIRSKEKNFFGDKTPGTETNQTFSTLEEGIEYGVDFFDKNKPYVNFRKFARQNDPNVSDLGEGMKGYNPVSDGGLGDKYVSWLNDKMLPYVVQRILQTIPEELSVLQNELTADERAIGKNTPYLAKAAPWLLSNKDKLGLQAIGELKTNMQKLQQVKYELETGKQAGTNYFIAPQTLGKRAKQPSINDTANQTNGWENNFYAPQKSWGGIPYAQGYGPQPISSSNISYSGNLFTIGMAAQGTSTAKADNNTKPLPSLSDMRQAYASSSAGSKNGGKGAGAVSINYQPNHTINNHSTTSMKDIHDTVVKVLTDAVSDYKIGTDIH